MTEYIEREDALRILENGEYWPIGKLEDDIQHLPAADVAEVRHGAWEYELQTINTLRRLKCTECGWWTRDLFIDGVYHYCPNCGAKMDKEADK